MSKVKDEFKNSFRNSLGLILLFLLPMIFAIVVRQDIDRFPFTAISIEPYILYFVLIVSLLFQYTIKAKYGKDLRAFLEIQFGLNFTILILILISDYLSKEVANSLSYVLLFVLYLYILYTAVKYMFNANYLIPTLMILASAFLGWLSLKHWQVISLIVVVLFQFLKYEDMKILFHDTIKDKNREGNTKAKRKFIQLRINASLSVMFFYLFLVVTDHINIYYGVLNMGSNDPTLKILMYKGLERMILFTVIYLVSTLLIKKSKSYEFLEKRAVAKINNFYANIFN